MRKMNLQLFAESIPAAGKIKRKWMAHYIDAALPSASKAEYSRLGKDLEEYIVEMNANVETKNNIWGETSVNLDSYQPQASADPHRTNARYRCQSLSPNYQTSAYQSKALHSVRTRPRL